MSKKMIASFIGIYFELDTSDEACAKFGYKHNQEITHPLLGKGKIEGIAPSIIKTNEPDKPNLLWCSFNLNGEIIFIPQPQIKEITK